MIKRIEFTLNLDDPREAEIYRALKPALRYRRAGAVIRQALGVFLISAERPLKLQEKNTDEQT
jgi:hypothetical protein